MKEFDWENLDEGLFCLEQHVDTGDRSQGRWTDQIPRNISCPPRLQIAKTLPRSDSPSSQTIWKLWPKTRARLYENTKAFSWISWQADVLDESANWREITNTTNEQTLIWQNIPSSQFQYSCQRSQRTSRVDIGDHESRALAITIGHHVSGSIERPPDGNQLFNWSYPIKYVDCLENSVDIFIFDIAYVSLHHAHSVELTMSRFVKRFHHHCSHCFS
jgi:hypothetical protein